jgi:hypothetical protein
MGRRPAHAPLRVYLNNRRVGTLSREANGAIGFAYHQGWLSWRYLFGTQSFYPAHSLQRADETGPSCLGPR